MQGNGSVCHSSGCTITANHPLLFSLSPPVSLTFGNAPAVLNSTEALLNQFLFTNGVNGCLRGVRFNGRAQDIQSGLLDSFPAQPGCPREEYCIPNPCGNDGLCVASWSGYSCQCGVDYEGHNCTEGM